MDNNISEALHKIDVSASMIEAAVNAVGICLSATNDDRAVIIYDKSTINIAAALDKAFSAIDVPTKAFNLDSIGDRPLATLPGKIASALKSATVSAMAVITVRGELSLRRLVLDLVAEQGIRHAHMPAITDEVFVDGLSMDYREIAEFIEMLIALAEKNNSITMTSPAGTNLEFNYTTPLIYDKMDGLITRNRWQNLPSGQLIIYPNDASGIYVIDRNIGDWFEHKFDVTEHPVTLVIEDGKVRTINCDNKRLEREIGLFLRSSDNSGRISELVIGANLGLTQDRPSSLLDSYRPSASLVLGAFDHGHKVNWSSATLLPVFGSHASLFIGARQIMMGDAFSTDLLKLD